jgi:BON domain
MSAGTQLSDADPEYVLGHVVQALSEDPRAAELDVQVRIGECLVVLEGCVTTEEHRAAIEVVVRDLLPAWDLDNRVHVQRWEAPDRAEAI